MPGHLGLAMMPFFTSTSVPNLLLLSISTNLFQFWKYSMEAWMRDMEMSSEIFTSMSLRRPKFIFGFQAKLTKWKILPFVLDWRRISYRMMQGLGGLGMSTVQNFLLSMQMRYLKAVLHISQVRATQLIVTQCWVFTTLSRLASHAFRQLRWIYFTEPEHLQGVMSGLSYSPGSRQILHSCSLVVSTDWDYLALGSSWTTSWLFGSQCFSDRSQYTVFFNFVFWSTEETFISGSTISRTLTFCFPSLRISRY